MTLFGIVGAGGFAREVMPIARESLTASHPGSELVFVVEDQFFSGEKVVNGHRLLSMSQFLSADGEKRFNIAIGSSAVRQRIAGEMKGMEPFSVVASNHVRYDGNDVRQGAIFCAFSHVTSNAKVGRFFHCNIYAYVAHDCVIGDFVTFAPGVMCNGHVVVEDHAYIGTGAVIRDGSEKPIVIGRGAVVGMGAVVTKSVPAGSTVVGNPARPVQ